MTCCNFGQISVKVSLNKTDFLINEIANILIQCDSTLSTKNIANFQFDLLSKSFYSEELIYPQIYNTIYAEGQSDQKFQFIQKFPIICANRLSSAINPSLECPGFAQQHFIQITCNTGILSNSITFQLPIIVYKTYDQNLKDNINNIGVHELFIQDFYNELEKIKLLNLKISQEKWKDQKIDFYNSDIQQQESQQQERNNLILIQQKQ